MNVSVSFIDGVRLSLSGPNTSSMCKVRFIDSDSNELIYNTEIGPGQWAAPNPKYYVNWKIEIEDASGKNTSAIWFNCTDKKVFIDLDSKALGDTIAWIPYVEEFRKTHNCKIYVRTFHNYLFKNQYQELSFVNHDPSNISDLYAYYRIGCFDNNYHRNKNNWRLIPLQQVAADVLGIEYEEVRPKIERSDIPRTADFKYVAISEHSTLRAKYWNYPDGWQKLVDYINSVGLKVMSVSKEPTSLKNVIAMNGRPIKETINNIERAEFFVGVGSGPAWISWALGIPTVVISGFSLPYSEMKDCIRIHNSSVCTGCYNDITVPFERDNNLWCPRNKEFECSKSITPEIVINAIQPLLKDKDPYQTLCFGNIRLTIRNGYGKQGDLDIINEHFKRDIYMLEEIAKHYTPRNMVDVGGHIGCVSVKARQLWPDIEITAIEPNPTSAELYKRNVPSAKLISEFAVGPAGDYILVDNPRWSGGGLVIREGDPYPDNYKVTRKVVCKPINAFISGNIDLLKLDCEGAEFHVLEHLPHDTEVGCIVGEYHTGWARWKNALDKYANLMDWDVLHLDHNERIGNFVAGPSWLIRKLKHQNLAPIASNGSKKVLYIAPHLSTGGMPQYLLKCVEDTKSLGATVEVIEFTCISDTNVIQRNKLKALVPVHTLNGGKLDSIKAILERFNPDIVHMQEMPEKWLYDPSAEEALKHVYRKDRSYRLIETTHGVDVPTKKYLPDLFAFVSQFHANSMSSLGVPYRVVEYTIPKKPRPERTSALSKLGLSPSDYHILNVGLWTPGKNQGEVIEIAQKLPRIKFHLIGSRANNFREYWEPIVSNVPNNCILYDERDDVDSFYSSMDLFLFTSKHELNPLVVKEALSWSMPVLMRNLDTYCGAYDRYDLVSFIDDNIDATCDEIRSRVPSMSAELESLYF